MASASAVSPTPRTERRTYFEDVEVGVVLETPAMTVTAAHVSLFAGLAGGAPASDPELVPPLLALCLSSGLGWRVPQPPLVVLAFMAFDWKFHLPIRVGDTIRSRSHTAAKRAMKEGGVVFEQRELVNQREEVVQSGRLTLLVARRKMA